MWVRLLGPVDVVVVREVRAVRGLRRQATLAVLALNRGIVVGTDRLIESVWDGSASQSALNSLQQTISHLRTVLGDRGAIVARPPGYLLDVDELTDIEQVRRLAAQAAVDSHDRIGRLDAALTLWRGPSLAGVAALRALLPQVRQLDNLRLRLTQDLIDARLEVGEHAALLPELQRLASEHPFDERTQGQLILALYWAG